MPDSNTLQKARQFADLAYSTATETLGRQLREDMQAMQAKRAALGTVLSGGMIGDAVKLHGEFIDAAIKARLNGFIEGCDRHSVTLDNQTAQEIITELMKLKDTMMGHSKQALRMNASIKAATAHTGGFQRFESMIETHCTVAPASLKLELDRVRFPRRSEMKLPPIHLSGHNPRVNINSTDNSVNIVMSQDQVFSELRQKIQADVAGEEQKQILEKLAALEKEHDSPTGWQRYSEFISVAANHMTLLAPYIPALTEMVHRM